MILLDTHAWLWWLGDPGLLSGPARERIASAERDATVAVSAISAWEAAVLVKKGRLELTLSVAELVAHCERLPVLRFLPVTPRIGIGSVALEPLHPDPADRLIVATARAHNAILVTKDARLLAFDGIRTLW